MRTIVIILIGLLIGYFCQPLLVGAWAEEKLSTPMAFSEHHECLGKICPYYVKGGDIVD